VAINAALCHWGHSSWQSFSATDTFPIRGPLMFQDTKFQHNPEMHGWDIDPSTDFYGPFFKGRSPNSQMVPRVSWAKLYQIRGRHSQSSALKKFVSNFIFFVLFRNWGYAKAGNENRGQISDFFHLCKIRRHGRYGWDSISSSTYTIQPSGSLLTEGGGSAEVL